jgi:hypothetical protein
VSYLESSQDSKNKLEVWIGLVGAKPLPDSEFFGEGVIGGYSNALVLASNEEGFREEVVKALETFNVLLTEVEDVEPLSARTSKWEVDEELLTLADVVRVSGSPMFGTWHVYSSVDEE